MNSSSMKRVEDQTVKSMVQCNECNESRVPEKEVNSQEAGNNSKHSDTIKSRVQGKEIKPQEGCDDFQHRDKEKSLTIKSRVLGEGIPQERAISSSTGTR